MQFVMLRVYMDDDLNKSFSLFQLSICYIRNHFNTCYVGADQLSLVSIFSKNTLIRFSPAYCMVQSVCR